MNFNIWLYEELDPVVSMAQANMKDSRINPEYVFAISFTLRFILAYIVRWIFSMRTLITNNQSMYQKQLFVNQRQHESKILSNCIGNVTDTRDE